MRISFLKIFVFLGIFNVSFSQKEKTLLTIDGKNISTTEFLKLYNKNIDLVKDESQKDLDNYLDLFINYKLKLKEAKHLGLDKDANYRREFENYKQQLTKNYISDNKVTEALVREAYDRMRYDIKASHILILDDPKIEDTLIAYNKLLAYRKVLKNDGYKTAKTKYHDGKSILVEDLGYFSAFKMVYDFESKAYQTKPGDVSMPFRTNFGFHVVRVDEKRLSKGTVTASHIMIALKQKDSSLNPEKRINSIYKKLKQGESFENLAMQFSDDKSSARNKGKLRPFKSGQLSSTIFENAAFELENEGEISKPIKTEYGWHIIKLIKKEPLKPFEEVKSTLEAKVKRDSRSKLINSAMVKELTNHYTIVKNNKAKVYFNSILEDGYLEGKFNLPKDYNGEAAVITINDSVFTNNDFLQHLKSKQRQYMRQNTTVKKVLDTEFELFYENSVLDFRKQNLVNENPEFADVLSEYRDGLLLFALMEKEIWNKASKDSVGLKKYYENNKAKYRWEDRVEATIVTSSTYNDAKTVQQLLRQNNSVSLVEEKLKKDGKTDYIFTSGIFEASNVKLPSKLEFKKGISTIYEHNGGYQIYVIEKVMPAANKTLNEARGNVVNDYQNQIEVEWLKELRNKFTVEVNKNVFKQLKAKMN